MRGFLSLFVCLAMIGAAPPTLAGEGADQPRTTRLSSRECGLSTPYNVQVDGGGVWLYRQEGTPQEIFFHDGTLSVDQRVQQVSPADAQRLRRMEDGARALMPQVAGLTRESVALTFDALAGVTRGMTGSARKARKVERSRDQALAQIDGSLGNGRWDQDVFGEAFEANVESVIADLTGSLVRSALWAAVTGRADEMDARADRVHAQIDRQVDARSAALEARADAMCTQVVALRALQDALDYRYRGKPLVMLAPEDARKHDIAVR